MELVIFDPDMRKKLTLDDLHADSDYSIWEGFECQGYPVMTILRGQINVEDGRLLGALGAAAGRGRMSRRSYPGYR